MQEKRRSFRSQSAAMIAPASVLPVKHTLRLNHKQAVYELTVEATAPMFCLAVAADAHVTFLESAGSVAILTTSKASEGSAYKSLATYRCAHAQLHP